MLDFNDFPDCARTPPIREIITKRLIPRLNPRVNILHSSKARKKSVHFPYSDFGKKQNNLVCETIHLTKT